MAIQLQKGQKIDLTKGAAGLSKLLVGLGWDEAERSSGGGGGFFSNIFGGSGGSADIDCDASVIMVDNNGAKHEVVYFGHLRSSCGSVIHTGDNLTGAGDGDDEQIIVELNRIPPQVAKLIFVVNIYDCIRRKQDFGLIRNAFIRVDNADTGEVLAKYNLSEDYAGKTALVVGEIYRYQNEWKFGAIGQGTNDASISELVQRLTR